MKDLSYERFFHTLSNENRLQILNFLKKNGPKNVSQIVSGTDFEQSAVSHNLKHLLSCEFVHLKRRGKQRIYFLNNDTIRPLLSLIDKHVEKYCRGNCLICDQQKRGDVKHESKT